LVDSAGENVVAAAPVEGVVSRIALQQVAACAAQQVIVATLAGQRVVALASADGICRSEANQGIVSDASRKQLGQDIGKAPYHEGCVGEANLLDLPTVAAISTKITFSP